MLIMRIDRKFINFNLFVEIKFGNTPLDRKGVDTETSGSKTATTDQKPTLILPH